MNEADEIVPHQLSWFDETSRGKLELSGLYREIGQEPQQETDLQGESKEMISISGNCCITCIKHEYRTLHIPSRHDPLYPAFSNHHHSILGRSDNPSLRRRRIPCFPFVEVPG